MSLYDNLNNENQPDRGEDYFLWKPNPTHPPIWRKLSEKFPRPRNGSIICEVNEKLYAYPKNVKDKSFLDFLHKSEFSNDRFWGSWDEAPCNTDEFPHLAEDSDKGTNYGSGRISIEFLRGAA